MPADADHAQEFGCRIDGRSHHRVFCAQHQALDMSEPARASTA